MAVIENFNAHLLPNTAGCHSVKEAVTTAQMARELFGTRWIKLEVIGDDYNLQPEPFALLEATRELISQGFEVFPYCTDDLVLCQKLVDAGCRILMPWGAPIGTGKGLLNPYALKTLRERLPEITLVVDAVWLASHAAQAAMELGYDAVLLNTAIAQATQPVRMAEAFRHAVISGRYGYEAGVIQERDIAQPSTPALGTPFGINDPIPILTFIRWGDLARKIILYLGKANRHGMRSLCVINDRLSTYLTSHKRKMAFVQRPTVINCVGNDTAGLAGRKIDISTQRAFAVHSATVITATTAQNNQQVQGIYPVDTAIFQQQLDALSSTPFDVVKIGLLPTLTQAEYLCEWLQSHPCPVVLDTVLGSSSGCCFVDDELLQSIQGYVFHLVSIITPNLEEAERLTHTAHYYG